MKHTLPLSMLLLPLITMAAPPIATPGLPPLNVVERTLRNTPMVQAAGSNVRAEEAHRDRLNAGSYEWNLRVGNQQRKSNPLGSSEQKFNEWNAAIERPVRMPGKAGLDSELGNTGVALAETARGDAMHETARNLLRGWFAYLRESAGARQWAAQVDLLEKQARSIRRRQQLGDAARLDTVLAAGALAQAEAQLAQARVREQTAGEDLRRRYPDLPLDMPATIVEPQPIEGTQPEWIEAILSQSHELALARGSSERAHLLANRIQRDNLPDPTFGMHVSSERGGEDHIVGAYVSIPLPGQARRAGSDVALAQADSADRMTENETRKITAEAAILYQSAQAAFTTWQAGRTSASRLEEAATMSTRAYQLGEGTLNDLLTARRLANEAALTSSLMQLDALELRYRLLLDAHRLWDFDDEPAQANIASH